tara:strand:- start:34 stop:333 length:300 start_codon:yes stop_codon:yes gene_type:complete
MAIYKNTTDVTTTLITKGEKISGRINEILICNQSTHSGGAEIDLYLENAAATKYYFLKEVVMPSGSSLLLDNDLSFDGSVFHLKIKNDGTSPSLTITIK